MDDHPISGTFPRSNYDIEAAIGSQLARTLFEVLEVNGIQGRGVGGGSPTLRRTG
jgi:hypothetical protein